MNIFIILAILFTNRIKHQLEPAASHYHIAGQNVTLNYYNYNFLFSI